MHENKTTVYNMHEIIVYKTNLDAWSHPSFLRHCSWKSSRDAEHLRGAQHFWPTEDRSFQQHQE